MKYKILTFGEQLNELRHRYHLTVKDLQKIHDLKSATQIQRMLNDECTAEHLEHFLSGLSERIQTGQHPFDQIDLASLKQSLEVTKYGKSTIYSRLVLLDLLTKQKCLTLSSKLFVSHSKQPYPITLKSFFERYKDHKQIHILQFEMPFKELTDNICHLIQNGNIHDVFHEHLIFIDSDPVKNADLLASVKRLVNYKNCHLYIKSKASKNMYSDTTNLLLIKRLTQDNALSFDLLQFTEEGQFKATEISDPNLFEHYRAIFLQHTQNSESIRCNDLGGDLLDNLITLCNRYGNHEKRSAEYLIKENFCVQMIPSDILRSLFSSSAIAMQLDSDPRLGDLIRINEERFENYYSGEHLKVNLFTCRGFKDFVTTGFMSDHVNGMNPFSLDSRRAILNFIKEQLLSNSNFDLRFFKADFYIGNLEYNYYEKDALYIFDSISGYGPDYEEGCIRAPEMLNIFDDFIKNEVIPYHTLTDHQNLEFLDEMLIYLDELAVMAVS